MWPKAPNGFACCTPPSSYGQALHTSAQPTRQPRILLLTQALRSFPPRSSMGFQSPNPANGFPITQSSKWVSNHPIQQMGFQPPNPANGFPTNQSSKRLSNHPIHPSSTQLSTPLLKPPQTPDPKPPILPTPKPPPPLTLAGIRCPLVPPLPRPHHPIARAGSSLCVPHASTSRLCTRGHEAV